MSEKKNADPATDLTIDPDTGRKYDYYKILNITEAEEDNNVIKKAYFKAAQKYHPDKNQNKDATMFIYIQEAYATLTSPQDRAFYNRNKNVILQTIDDEFDNVETFINLTALHRPQKNFYGNYNAAFTALAEEEYKAAKIRLELDLNISKEDLARCQYRINSEYPSFGDADTVKSKVSDFYF